MTSEKVIPCGTNGGYQKHRRRKEPRCEGCWAAHAAWQKNYRNSIGFTSARRRAEERVLAQHAAEFEGYLREEMVDA